MLQKIYFTLWAVALMTGAIALFAGIATAPAFIGFGFFLAGLIFIGMIGVLPTWAGQARTNH